MSYILEKNNMNVKEIREKYFEKSTINLFSNRSSKLSETDTFFEIDEKDKL